MSGSPAFPHPGETPCGILVSLPHFSISPELHSPGPVTPGAGCSQCHLVKDSRGQLGPPQPRVACTPQSLPSALYPALYTFTSHLSAPPGHPPVPILPELPQASAPHAWQGPEHDVSFAPSQGQSQTAGASSTTRQAPRSAPGSLPLQDPDYRPVHMRVQ